MKLETGRIVLLSTRISNRRRKASVFSFSAFVAPVAFKRSLACLVCCFCGCCCGPACRASSNTVGSFSDKREVSEECLRKTRSAVDILILLRSVNEASINTRMLARNKRLTMIVALVGHAVLQTVKYFVVVCEVALLVSCITVALLRHNGDHEELLLSLLCPLVGLSHWHSYRIQHQDGRFAPAASRLVLCFTSLSKSLLIIIIIIAANHCGVCHIPNQVQRQANEHCRTD